MMMMLSYRRGKYTLRLTCGASDMKHIQLRMKALFVLKSVKRGRYHLDRETKEEEENALFFVFFFLVGKKRAHFFSSLVWGVSSLSFLFFFFFRLSNVSFYRWLFLWVGVSTGWVQLEKVGWVGRFVFKTM